MAQTYTGLASWYQPGVGELGGGGKTSSGEMYNTKGFNVAIRQNLRDEFGGIYGKDTIGYAFLEANGKKAIVKVNDVGPLKGKGIRGNRVVDLAKGTKDYFGGDGLIKDVKITPLPGKHYKPGPVEPNATYAGIVAGAVVATVVDTVKDGADRTGKAITKTGKEIKTAAAKIAKDSAQHQAGNETPEGAKEKPAATRVAAKPAQTRVARAQKEKPTRVASADPKEEAVAEKPHRQSRRQALRELNDKRKAEMPDVATNRRKRHRYAHHGKHHYAGNGEGGHRRYASRANVANEQKPWVGDIIKAFFNPAAEKPPRHRKQATTTFPTPSPFGGG